MLMECAFSLRISWNTIQFYSKSLTDKLLLVYGCIVAIVQLKDEAR